MISDLEEILSDGEILEKNENMFEVDDKKAFLKLAENQFEDPFDGVRELIANAIDSYYKTREKPLIEINTKFSPNRKNNFFIITDYGSGMSDEKIKLLTTLGLTDKTDGEIGRFGVGFSSIFSKKLGIKEVTVDTNNHGKHYRLIFTPQENSPPSLKIYELNDKIEFGTKIKINSSDHRTIDHMEFKVQVACRYMPHKINLNNEPLQTVPLKISDKSWGININKKNIKGYIELTHHPCKTLRLLSKGILVESKEFEEFTNFYTLMKEGSALELFLPNIMGIINNDKFDLVLSRNQVVEDTEFQNTKEIILSKAPDLFLKLFDKYAKSSSEYYRQIILGNIVCNKQFFRRNALERFDYKRENNANRELVEKFLDAAVFQSWKGNYLSLKQIHNKIGKEGHIIFSSNKNLVKILDDEDPRNVLIKKEKVRKNGEDLFARLSYYAPPVIDLNVENIKELVDNDIIRLFVSDSHKRIDETELNNHQKSFLKEIEHILSIKEVKLLMRKYGLPDQVPVSYIKINKNSIIARYGRGKKEIHLNQNNPLIQNFIESKNIKNNTPYFIPVLSHELTHNELTGHLGDFYDKNSAFDSEMRMVMANYIADVDSNNS